jgi:hypothetical protein
LDSLGNKRLAAYLIAGRFGLRAHVEGTDARNTPTFATFWAHQPPNEVVSPVRCETLFLARFSGETAGKQ